MNTHNNMAINIMANLIIIKNQNLIDIECPMILILKGMNTHNNIAMNIMANPIIIKNQNLIDIEWSIERADINEALKELIMDI